MLQKKNSVVVLLAFVLLMFSSCSYFEQPSGAPGGDVDKEKSVEFINKGLAFQAQKKYDDALGAFRSAIEADRFNTDAYFYASYVSFLLKDMEGCYYYARKSTKIDKDFADGYLMASQVLLTRKRYKDALPLLRKLVVLEPNPTNHLYKNQFMVYYRMGICYIGMGQYKNGLNALKKSVSLARSAKAPEILVRSAKDMIRKIERKVN